MQLLEAHAHHVVSVGHPLVQANRLPQRSQGRIDVAGSIAGECHFVAHTRRSVIEVKRTLVCFGGASVPLELIEDVSQFFEGARRTGIESGSNTKISRSGIE